MEILSEKMEDIEIFEIATYLHPSFKALNIASLSDTQKNCINRKIGRLVREIDAEHGNSCNFKVFLTKQ